MKHLHFFTMLPAPILAWYAAYSSLLKPLLFPGWSDQAINIACAIGVGTILVYCWFLGSPPNPRTLKNTGGLFIALFVICLLLLWWLVDQVDAQITPEGLALWRDRYLFQASLALLLVFPLMCASILIAIGKRLFGP